MIGIDYAGKTTILQNLDFCSISIAEPVVIGFPAFKIHNQDIAIYSWSSANTPPYCSIWRTYFEKPDALIFVIDSSEKGAQYIERAVEGFQFMLSLSTLENIPLLVFANKRDLSSAYSETEIEEIYKFSDVGKMRSFHIQPCSAINKTGIHEGIEWILDTCNRYNRVKSARK